MAIQKDVVQAKEFSSAYDTDTIRIFVDGVIAQGGSVIATVVLPSAGVVIYYKLA